MCEQHGVCTRSHTHHPHTHTNPGLESAPTRSSAAGMIREKKAGCNHCIFPLSVVSVYESEAFKEMAETHMWCRVIIKDTRGISGLKGFETACRRSGESIKRSKYTVKCRSNVMVVGNVQPRTRETFSILAWSKFHVRSRVSEVFES